MAPPSKKDLLGRLLYAIVELCLPTIAFYEKGGVIMQIEMDRLEEPSVNEHYKHAGGKKRPSSKGKKKVGSVLARDRRIENAKARINMKAGRGKITKKQADDAYAKLNLKIGRGKI